MLPVLEAGATIQRKAAQKAVGLGAPEQNKSLYQRV